MQPIVLMLFAALAGLGLFVYHRHLAARSYHAHIPATSGAAGARAARVPGVSAPGLPALDVIAWDGPVSSAPTVDPASPRAAGSGLVMQRKIRDRYIAARFPCTAKSSADLENTERMIKAARLFFEEDQPDRAMELLSLAIEQSPEAASLRLAQIEIAFLMRDSGTYRTLALDFRRVHPASKEWDQIAKLGRKVAPEEAAFGRLAGATADAHYGPWPDTPNWIRASWDLTGEVAASDFHRAMKQA